MTLNDKWMKALENQTGALQDRLAKQLEDGLGGAPAPYSTKVGDNGKLQLYKGEDLIQEQDETGAWIVNAVRTGTGSLHLGELHSLGSGNENLVAVNNASGIAWYPAWGGVTLDGVTKYPVTARVHGATVVSNGNGNVQGGSPIDYNYTFTSPDDRAFFSVAIRPAENYTGRLRWRVVRENGLEVAAFNFDAALVTSTDFQIPFKYPLWARAGQTFTLSLTKEDGTFLQVRRGATNANEPYRVNRTATYVDHEVYHKSNRNTAQASLYLDSLQSVPQTFLSLGRMHIAVRSIQSVTSFLEMGSTVSTSVYWSDNLGASGQTSISAGGVLRWSKASDNNAVRTITFTARNALVGMSQTGTIQLKVDNYGTVDQRVMASATLTIAD